MIGADRDALQTRDGRSLLVAARPVMAVFRLVCFQAVWAYKRTSRCRRFGFPLLLHAHTKGSDQPTRPACSASRSRLTTSCCSPLIASAFNALWQSVRGCPGPCPDAVAPQRAEAAGSAPCYGALSYVYNHSIRDLARRLTDEGHHHGVSIASMHVHLTGNDCLEVAVLRGPVTAMRAYADSVITQARGALRSPASPP